MLAFRSRLAAIAIATLVAASGCGDDARGTAGNVVTAPAASFASRCAALPPAPSSVTAAKLVVDVDDSRPWAELTRMYERATPNHATLGLTHAQLGYVSSLAASGLREGPRTCMRVQVTVEISLAPTVVYIAREIAAEACRRDAVNAHEMRHVAVHAAFLREAPTRLHARLAAAGVDRVRIAQDAATIQADAAREVATIVAAAERADRAALAALQAQVDSPDEYARVGERCDTKVAPQTADGGQRPSDRR